MEDLWAFNEEVLARAIYDSKIPIISAVGHEVDTTIADLVADARASTPTKAGVVAVPDAREVLEKLSAAQSRLTGDIESVIELAEQRLQTICASAAFRNPLLQVRNRQQQLDEMGGNLEELIGDMITEARERLNGYYEQVVRIEPHRLIGRKMVEVNELRSRANAADIGIIGQGGIAAYGTGESARGPESQGGIETRLFDNDAQTDGGGIEKRRGSADWGYAGDGTGGEFD